MIAPTITPHTPASPLVCDEFLMGSSYTNWRPRGGGDWLLIYTADGSGAIGLGEKTLETRPGDLLLYEPQAAQDYGTAPSGICQWHLLWAHFVARPAWHLWLKWPEIAPQTHLIHLPIDQRRPCEEALHRMIQASRWPGPIQVDLGMAALEEVILRGRARQAEEGEPPADPRIAQATLWLTDRFKEPFHLPTLAKKCGLSVSRFSHLFRTRMGCTPGQFLEQLRLSHAAQLLRLTGLTIGEISAECGFENPFYFTNRFRRHHGMSPTAFRKRIPV